MSARRDGRFRRAIFRVAPFASFAGLSVLTAVDSIDPLAVLFGIGALVVAKRLLDSRGNERRELKRRIRRLEEGTERIGEGSTLRASFEVALESRRGELATYNEIP